MKDKITFRELQENQDALDELKKWRLKQRNIRKIKKSTRGQIIKCSHRKITKK